MIWGTPSKAKARSQSFDYDFAAAEVARIYVPLHQRA
jgi:hypothetical protein